MDKAQNNNTSIFHLGNPNGRKPNNLRLEMIILRSEYNEEERENMEKLSKDRNPKKQSSSAVYVNFSLSQKTANFSVLLCCCCVQ